ncbi:OmpA family protein [Flavobacterium sp. J27]|uniref:OmpA family protein n=1 Tax=Flavobacterium sp. J27 TaxID=2060419 RepID=UPI001030D118|nr:OmpA family protein [Flavobacterium sp. J27]
MKTILTLGLLLLVTQSNAQFFKKLSEKAEKAAERTVERRVEKKSEETTDQSIDKVFEKKKKKDKKTKGNDSQNEETNSKTESKKTTITSAKDFVAGTKIIATENFNQDAIGDFPVNWYTNSSGEIVTFSDSNEKWLKLNDKGNYTPIHFSKLPENCTFEVDIYTTENFSFYSSGLNIAFVASQKKTDYTQWGDFKSGKEGVIVSLHPQGAGSRKMGVSGFKVITNHALLMENNVDLKSFNHNLNTAKVQFWRQKNRLRVYVNGEKIWDLPNAFQETTYNNIVFYMHTYGNPEDKYYISNLKLAEAGADTRHKLIETGTFSTNEILFDSNKATIKNTSKTVLSDLGNALKENPSVKIKIIGHTDSDGKEIDNQRLSSQRAESVKIYLNTNFGIEKSRMLTEGKGESNPIASNNTEEGKKQNRRVEFTVIK